MPTELISVPSGRQGNLQRDGDAPVDESEFRNQKKISSSSCLTGVFAARMCPQGILTGLSFKVQISF